MNVDDLEYGWGEIAYVWLRPSKGRTWADFFGDGRKVTEGSDWVPGRISGFSDEHFRDMYNTSYDTRRVELFGHAGTFSLSNFEIGGLLQDFTETPSFSVR